jgi:hypothetical protein
MISVSAIPVLIRGLPFVRIQVADNGIGFDPAFNEQIFDTFIRLHSKIKYDGTGLGLSLCRKIVERHKGEICADGINNGGAKFTITLPVRQGRTSLA